MKSLLYTPAEGFLGTWEVSGFMSRTVTHELVIDSSRQLEVRRQTDLFFRNLQRAMGIGHLYFTTSQIEQGMVRHVAKG